MHAKTGKFLEGGCYWLAKFLQNGIPLSYIMINRMEEHCALYFENGLYDVRGRISINNFKKANERTYHDSFCDCSNYWSDLF